MKTSSAFNWNKLLVTALRVAIGWHFLYEGLSKLLTEGWSSYNYLINSKGFLAEFYHTLASSSSILKFVDILNIYGLLLIGLALFIGWLKKYAAIGGALLLTLYYFAYPPFGISLMDSSDGSLYIVNKIFIEAVALLLLVFLKEDGYGIDNLVRINLKSVKTNNGLKNAENQSLNSRRELLKNMFLLPGLGIIGWAALSSKKKYSLDVMSGATIQVRRASLSELKGDLPKGNLGDSMISRLILGGNLIGGWMHSRDLSYVSPLSKAYNTEKRVYETLMLAEQAGINSINIGFPSNQLMAKYKQLFGSKIKVISQVAPNMKDGDIYEEINKAIDFGADILQIQGNWCDWLVRDNNIDVVGKMLARMREQGYTAGLASHTIDSLIACEEQGIIPDYYMKTMHHDQYWSAHPRENRKPFEVDGKRYLDHDKFHDNLFCLFPDRTLEFVARVKVPVMGYKILAAGAIKPEDGFNWAFENGADFICVGMFDFQIVDDVNICIETLVKLQNRQRDWYA